MWTEIALDGSVERFFPLVNRKAIQQKTNQRSSILQLRIRACKRRLSHSAVGSFACTVTCTLLIQSATPDINLDDQVFASWNPAKQSTVRIPGMVLRVPAVIRLV